MLEFLKRRRKRERGWLAIALEGDRAHFARVVTDGDQRALVQCGSQELGDEKKFERAAKELGFDRCSCLTVLASADYQLFLVDAPNVPGAEMKNAARWRIKDMLDYAVDLATVDVLDIPVDPGGTSRGHSIYAVAARNEGIRSCMERFARMRLPLSVIDISETAQRNIAALLEPPDRAVALLYPGKEQMLLTVNFRGELYMARRIDVGLEELEKLAIGGSDEAKNRTLLEVQRSFDHLERQFPFVNVAKLLIAPTPVDTGLQSYLAENLDVAVEEVRLAELLRLAPDVELDRQTAWRSFHLIGAALRPQAGVS